MSNYVLLKLGVVHILRNQYFGNFYPPPPPPPSSTVIKTRPPPPNYVIKATPTPPPPPPVIKTKPPPHYVIKTKVFLKTTFLHDSCYPVYYKPKFCLKIGKNENFDYKINENCPISITKIGKKSKF